MKGKGPIRGKENASSNKKGASEKPLQIVAIGASAGGLEAITELLLNLSPGTGMGFIYVQHLSPDHKSILCSLLAKSTRMKVQEVTNKILIEANNLYVIPPDKEISITDGHIKLMPRTKERGVHLPINKLFASLAEKHKERAIGVVLSGSANDGTLGLMAIKEGGGLTFAQDDTAKFNSMPQSAVTAGAVDFILSPREIALELSRISKHDYVRDLLKVYGESEIQNTDPSFKHIIDLLVKQTGVDFSQYKTPTIKRRILRRMLLANLKSLKEYAKFVSAKNDEINILYQDLLINVTNFFRDTDAHRYLKTKLFPKLLASKAPGEKLRIWIPACATGEEAYSIAMTLLEIQSSKGTNIPVQIFATDLSTFAIAKARIGEYSKSELKMVSPTRLQRFYSKSGVKFRISKVVRDLCVFAPHNILRDPPFSKVDLVSCCNLFIYLETDAQNKALATFHYALNEHGYLMLGKSETIGTATQLFHQTNTKLKIYSRIHNATLPKLPPLSPRIPRVPEVQHNAKDSPDKNFVQPAINFEGDVDSILLSRFVPASVVIDQNMDVVQFRGETETFLRHVSGKASLNILKLAPPEIGFELRHLIPVVFKTWQPFRKSTIEIKTIPNLKMVTLEIVPVGSKSDEPRLLILFTKPEVVETFMQPGKGDKKNTAAKDRRINKLEEALHKTRTDMLSFTRDQEAFTKELQTANEEIVSSNEELQSVNEELETSKEEIESTNEELITTNQELQTRNDLLNESYEYSEAILNNIHEPLLILDKDLRVISANKSFYKRFTFTPDETEGVLLYDVGNKEWNIPALKILLEDILRKNSHFQDFEVTHTFPRLGEKIMLLNASRIIQKTHREQLILLAIADITETRKKTIDFFNKEKELLAQSEKHFHFIADSMPQKVWTADVNGDINYFNKCWLDYTGLPFEELKGWGWKKIVYADDWDETRGRWNHSVETGINFEFEHRFLNTKGEYKWHLTRGLPIRSENGKVSMWIGTNTEIHEHQQQKQELEKAVAEGTQELRNANLGLEQKNIELLNVNKGLESFSYIASHDLQEPLRKIQTLVDRILVKESQQLSENGIDYFQRIRKSANRMQQLIQDILEFSKLNIGERKYIKTNINSIVEQVKTELNELIEQKGAIIEVGELCDVLVIPYQFLQLMTNIIGNALKFSNPDVASHITITSKNIVYSKLNIENLPPLKEYCHITISDNGMGFEPEYNEKIFELFQRVHDKDKYTGTGIGLAIVRKIVDNHNGIITARSEPGKGSSFEIYIPACS